MKRCVHTVSLQVFFAPPHHIHRIMCIRDATPLHFPLLYISSAPKGLHLRSTVLCSFFYVHLWKVQRCGGVEVVLYNLLRAKQHHHTAALSKGAHKKSCKGCAVSFTCYMVHRLLCIKDATAVLSMQLCCIERSKK